MTLETRPPTPADIIRIPNSFHFEQGGTALSSFPPTMLHDQIAQPARRGMLTAATVGWILVVAGLGVGGMLIYQHYQRKNKSKRTDKIASINVQKTAE